MRFLLSTLFRPVVLTAMLIAGCDSTPESRTTQDVPPAVFSSIDIAGCENVIRVSPSLISGGEPRGEDAFRAIAGQGIKTIISVDGTRPDAELAKRYGMRYVHLPIGYDGVPSDTGLSIARAVRDLPGPVYMHCHHGLHRGPAAAAYAAIAVEGWDADRATGFMKSAGTAESYTGLYQSVQSLNPPTQAELDHADNTFPEAAALPGLTVAMAEIDRRWDHLKAVRAAGWQTPAEHPDIDPPHETLLLRELFTELNRAEQMQDRPDDYRRWMRNAQQSTESLEQALRRADHDAAETAFIQIGGSCKTCHQSFRNPPK